MIYHFWKKESHYELGYNADYTAEFKDYQSASKYCDDYHFECFIEGDGN